MKSSAPTLVSLALALVVGGCSAVLPLGDEYTFGGGVDGGSADGGGVDGSVVPDGGADGGEVPMDDAGPDAGCEVPAMEEVCADRCGEIVACGQTFTCGTCDGELSCGGGGTANVCGCAESPCALFTERFGDASIQVIRGLAVDHEGNVFVAGDFRGTIRFGSNTHTNVGATRYDMFLVKFDRTGHVLWSKSFGGLADATTDHDQWVRGLAVDGAGNVILAGETSGIVNFGGGPLENDIAIAKFTGDGEHVWSAVYGTQYSSYPTSIAVDPGTYDVVMTGDFWGTLRFGSLIAMTAAGTQAYHDMFVVRFRAADGVPQSSARYGDGSEQLASSIAVSRSHAYVAAVFHGTFDFGAPNPTPLTSSTWYSLAISRLGVGTFSHSWSRKFGTDVWAPLVAADAEGDLIVSGWFSGSLDIVTPALTSTSGAAFLAELDVGGTTRWARKFENVTIAALTVGADGSIYIAGAVAGETDLGAGPVDYDGTRNAFFARFTGDGEHVFSRVFASSSDQLAAGIGATSDGEVWLGVDLQGALDLGTGELRTEGATDIAIGRYVP